MAIALMVGGVVFGTIVVGVVVLVIAIHVIAAIGRWWRARSKRYRLPLEDTRRIRRIRQR